MSSFSSGSSVSINDVIRNTLYNESEIAKAPEEYLNHFSQQYINNLETVQVTAEAPWDENGEKLLRRWMAQAKDCSKAHRSTAYKLKHLYRLLSITVIITASCVFLTSSLFPCTVEPVYKVITVFISFINLTIANISNFFDFGPKYQLHFQYEGLWIRYALDIEELLVTDHDYRPPKDKSIVEYRERMGNLISSAPEL